MTFSCGIFKGLVAGLSGIISREFKKFASRSTETIYFEAAVH